MRTLTQERRGKMKNGDSHNRALLERLNSTAHPECHTHLLQGHFVHVPELVRTKLLWSRGFGHTVMWDG